MPKWHAGPRLRKARVRDLFPKALRRDLDKLGKPQVMERYGEVEIGGRLAHGRRGVGLSALSWRGEPRVRPKVRWLEERMRQRFAALLEALDAEAET